MLEEVDPDSDPEELRIETDGSWTQCGRGNGRRHQGPLESRATYMPDAA